MGAFSLGLSAKLVMRFGIRGPLALGMTLVAVGLLLFARAPVDGSLLDVLPA
jgi:fucose permease